MIVMSRFFMSMAFVPCSHKHSWMWIYLLATHHLTPYFLSLSLPLWCFTSNSWLWWWQVITVSGTVGEPNEITIGRIFLDLAELEEISITHSNVPAIGDSSFWPGTKMKILDLSNNRIRLIRDSDFNGLVNLSSLNLSRNVLTEVPSAAFHHMPNLLKLDLTNNKLSKLVPRLFFKLDKLEYLDISENPLTVNQITEDTFKDSNSLKILKMSKSNIKAISLLAYKELPNLKELHLSSNKISFISAYEFSSLSSLKYLYLDDNDVHTIRNHAFNGLRLIHLTLARNKIVFLPSCVFCNLILESLDLSSNMFTAFQPDLLQPLSLTLIFLGSSGSSSLEKPSESVNNLLSPLKRLQILRVASSNIDNGLNESTFSSMNHLRFLDLSSNKLSNLSEKWFEPMNHLETLDLSNNLLPGISQDVLSVFDSMSLKAIYLQKNPWICKRCQILPLMDWINTRSPLSYSNVCNTRKISPDPKTSSGDNTACITCSYPDHLSGKNLHLITELDLEYCPDPRINLRLTSSEPKVGLALGILIIISLVIMILSIVLSYKFKDSAVYYTHEEERDEAYDYDRSASIGCNGRLSHVIKPSCHKDPLKHHHLHPGQKRRRRKRTFCFSIYTTSNGSPTHPNNNSTFCSGRNSMSASSCNFSRKFRSFVGASPGKYKNHRHDGRKSSNSSCNSTSPLSEDRSISSTTSDNFTHITNNGMMATTGNHHHEVHVDHHPYPQTMIMPSSAPHESSHLNNNHNRDHDQGTNGGTPASGNTTLTRGTRPKVRF